MSDIAGGVVRRSARPWSSQLGDPRSAGPAAAAAAAPVPARVADVGCGTGTLAVLLSQAGHRVSGIDFAPRLVDHARGKALAAGVVTDFAVADAMTPP